MKTPENSHFKVSVIISNYNYGHFLSEAIQSVIDQNYDPLEIIVVDDGSTDNSRDVIESFGDNVTPIFQENSGQAQAINAGFSASTGDIICLLDGDDYFADNKLHKIANIFANDPECEFVFHAVEKRKELSKDMVGRTPLQREGTYDERSRIRKLGRTNIFLPATSAYCIKRNVLKEIMPLPAEKGITVSDKFIGNMVLSKAKGYYSNEMHSILRLHGSNLYSGSSRNLSKIGKIGMATAYWVYVSDNSLVRYATVLSAKAMAALRVSGDMDARSKEYKSRFMNDIRFLDKAAYLAIYACYYCTFKLKRIK